MVSWRGILQSYYPKTGYQGTRSITDGYPGTKIPESPSTSQDSTRIDPWRPMSELKLLLYRNCAGLYTSIIDAVLEYIKNNIYGNASVLLLLFLLSL